ncbi:hypothetical protein WOLCODRAFT_85356 [Wolfiporia cocos MD-104 SS10]|uniref:Uncharacterized protein n=1 Tax=Wolfiporia cocos (strain MD-104) TaxID=742152 RepID=A0A2H3JAN1_WOLCO|nr:hypothetical protein WOLCODRAFT_85356 [Wolfiporia cocos MD-104 SS10]
MELTFNAAAGTTRQGLLFQASSEQMICAYSHMPRLYGTIFTNEVFSLEVMLSE